jgi:hypothetical protein
MRLFYCTNCGNVTVSHATETSGQHMAILVNSPNGATERKCAVRRFVPVTMHGGRDVRLQERDCGGRLVPVMREMLDA